MILQELPSDVGVILLVGDDRHAQLGERLGGELRGDRVEDLLEVGRRRLDELRRRRAANKEKRAAEKLAAAHAYAQAKAVQGLLQ